MTTKAKTELTLKGKVDILRANRVHVWDWKEPGDSRFFPLPTVFFNGDENEGDRAARVMREHGVYVWRVWRNWHYEGLEEPHRTHWEMLFSRP